MVITQLIEDIALWSHRIKNSEHKARIMLWRDHLSSCIMKTRPAGEEPCGIVLRRRNSRHKVAELGARTRDLAGARTRPWAAAILVDTSSLILYNDKLSGMKIQVGTLSPPVTASKKMCRAADSHSFYSREKNGDHALLNLKSKHTLIQYNTIQYRRAYT
jgi:hypothetical protein